MIGGEYYLSCNEVEGNLAGVARGIWRHIEYRCTGRDAIHAVVSIVSAPRIWLPDYLCESIYRPVRDLGVPFEFYHVERFDSTDGDWDGIGREGDCVLLIHYFGIPQTRAIESLRRRNITIISDVTHLMLNPSYLVQIGSLSDFSVCSLRKTAGLPDGGFLASAEHEIPAATFPAREQFWTLRAAALLSRGGSAAAGFVSDENFVLFRRAEQSLDGAEAGSHAMSDCSRYMLATLPWQEWAAKTALNHTILRQLIDQTGIETNTGGYSHLFPVLLESKLQRDCVRGNLLKMGIVAPIHWDTSFLGKIHWMSDRILSLPCDYRYTEAEMEYSAKAFREYR